jgi:SAM-dependent methyltransferase
VNVSDRLNAPIWRHDAYTLRGLQAAIEGAIDQLGRDGVLAADRGTVVDFGCGDVPYRELFSSFCKRYLACDIEPGPGVDLTFEPGGSVALESGVADCVVSFQVLEHVWDLGAYLGECRRLLGPGGRLVLSTHGTWLYHPHPGDYRRWTRDGLVRELRVHGFDVVRVFPVVGALAWTTQFRLLGYHHVVTRIPLLGRLLFPLLSSVMYIRMVLEDLITPDSISGDNSAIYLVIATCTDPS